MIAFLDANALIYLIEGAMPFSGRVRKRLQALADANKDMRLGVSSLSRLECRVGPMQSGDTEALAAYDTFFSRPDLINVELGTTVIDLATAIRARDGLKTPDALQAACCLQLGKSHVFLTGDKGFRRVTGLNVQLLG